MELITKVFPGAEPRESQQLRRCRERRGGGVRVAPDAVDATSILEHAIAACREHGRHRVDGVGPDV